MNEMSARPLPPVLEGLRIVDADTHISEWDDLWTSRAPAKFKDRVPQKRIVNGKRLWTIDGDKSMGTGCPNSAIRADGAKPQGLGFLEWDLEDAHKGAYDVKARLQYMDQYGIWAQIGYGNILGFGGQAAGQVDPELRHVSTVIYNDAMAEVQQQSNNRIFPMALMPWWDVKLAVAEAKRCAKMGMKGVNINSDPQTHGLPDLGDAHWTPFWETCVEHDLPVNFHIGASDQAMSFALDGQWKSSLESEQRTMMTFSSTMLFFGNARVLANIILSRFLEKFPTLKIVSVESGVGWIPFLLEAMEYQMSEAGVGFDVRPVDLFRRQIYACSWFEREFFASTARMLGVDNVMFETDFPHPTCLYPDPMQHVASAAAAFTPDERKKVFSTNAARVYNLSLPT